MSHCVGVEGAAAMYISDWLFYYGQGICTWAGIIQPWLTCLLCGPVCFVSAYFAACWFFNLSIFWYYISL